jgi:FHA domain
MRPSWSSMLALMAAIAVAHASVAAAANAAETSSSLLSFNAELPNAAAPLFAVLGDGGAQAWLQLYHWVEQNYERAPALMLGLSVLLAVPPLALAGFFTRRRRRASNLTIALPRKARGTSSRPRLRTTQTEISPWPTEAWVEADGYPGSRRIIGRTLLRIGREEDNDIRFAVKTVHRYHAVIRRTTDGVVMITDLSGKDGNGVLVNGARVAEARLRKGDVINLGEVRMRFDARPV